MITGEEVSALTIAAGATSETIAYNWTLTSTNWYSFSNTSRYLGTQTAVESGQTGSTELSWLVENTFALGKGGATSNTYGNANQGYWTLSPRASDSRYAWLVDYSGSLSRNSADYGGYAGIRPVITLPKSVLE